MKRLNYIIAVTTLFTGSIAAQTGGDNTYEFLNLSTSSLVTSMGGLNVSVSSEDPSLIFYNPALLQNSEAGSFALNYVNYFAGINYGSAVWTGEHPDAGRFAIGLLYLNYGTFERSDPAGLITGSFKAAEYALNLTWNYQIDSLINAGVSIKPVLSHLESYSSFGLSFDLGVSYKSRDGLVTAGLVLSNAGFQITSYTGYREKLPTSLTAGITTRPEHAPFRFSLTVHNLEKWNLIHSYTDEEREEEKERYRGIAGLSENVMRHMIISAEFIPSPNFFVSAGFNYMRRKELSIEYRTSNVGFSSGFGIRLSSFDLSYSRSRFHLAGSVNNVSLIVKPGAFTRRK